MPSQDHTLRIIGGNWRRRKVSFPDAPGLRPTPGRVRETLFNWLQGSIAGARCLELYAGSGILSIEALSRGAAHVSIIEQNSRTARAINGVLQELGAVASTYDVINTAALTWLETASTGSFDVAFIDPPFDGDEMSQALAATTRLIAAGGLIYVEAPSPLDAYDLPGKLTVLREKRAGRVHFGLLANSR